MSQRLLIGNIISLSASVFLFSGSITQKVRRVYLFGVFECIFLFSAQLFFHQGAAAVSLLIAAFRNYLLFIGKYTRAFLILIFFLTLFLGLFFNTGGALGLIPLFATLIYTLTSYCAKSYVNVKLNLFLNLGLWTLYSVFIYDVGGAVINIFSIILTLISIFKYLLTGRES